jgi:hypothetical protein
MTRNRLEIVFKAIHCKVPVSFPKNFTHPDHRSSGVRLLTRRGNDWTARYPSIANAVAALACRSCLLDGEVVVCGDDGVPVFDRLRYGRRPQTEAVLFAFDLLELAEKSQHAYSSSFGGSLGSQPTFRRRAYDGDAPKRQDHRKLRSDPAIPHPQPAPGPARTVSPRLRQSHRDLPRCHQSPRGW